MTERLNQFLRTSWRGSMAWSPFRARLIKHAVRRIYAPQGRFNDPCEARCRCMRRRYGKDHMRPGTYHWLWSKDIVNHQKRFARPG